MHRPLLRRMAAPVACAAVLAAGIVPGATLAAPATELTGKVMTVNGPIDPGTLGRTLVHEHIFIDARVREDTPQGWAAAGLERPATPAGLAIYNAPLTMNLLGTVALGAPNRDNAVLDDEKTAIHEVMRFKQHGGGAIVDLTSVGLRREEKFRVLDIVASEGVDLKHVVMGHSNSLAVDIPFARRVLARGVFIEFDYLGAPGSPGGYIGSRNDFKVAQGIAQLVREGYTDRIVPGHDVCQKIQLKKYGGTGFTYISDYFLPALRRLGVPDDDRQPPPRAHLRRPAVAAARVGVRVLRSTVGRPTRAAIPFPRPPIAACLKAAARCFMNGTSIGTRRR